MGPDAGNRPARPIGHGSLAGPRRLVALSRQLQGGAEWVLALRVLGWLAILPLLKHAVPLPRLTRLMWRGGYSRLRDPAREERAVAIVGGLSRRTGGNCLERSLVLYRLLSRLNAEPLLVAGMGRAGELVGHAWVTVDGEPLLESRESLAGYVEVLRFGAEGRQHPTPDNPRPR